MSYELYAAFVSATVLLILLPGPNVAVIVANSMSHGVRYGFITVAGVSSGMAIQLSLTILGLAGLLALVSTWFEWLRWFGVAYLVFLGFGIWRAAPIDLSTARPQPKSRREIYLKAFVVSLTNPKTLLFYAAFLPQFVSSEHARAPQLVILAATFIAIALVLDCGWVLFANRARGALGITGRLLNRLTGGIILAAAAGLAAARAP